MCYIKRKQSAIEIMGKLRFKVTKKGIYAVGGVIVLLLAMVGAGLFVWWLQNKDSLPTTGAGGYSKTAEKPLPSAADEAQKLAIAGKTEEAADRKSTRLNSSHS